MKKIILSVLSVLMIFGLIGCSGDLHDDVYVDPNAMEGNWFYKVIDVSAAEGTINLIFNDGSNQTEDIKGVDISGGSVAYIWAAKSGKSPAEVSTRTDCPDKSDLGGAGKLVVYCFSNAAKVNIWAWDDANNYSGGAWPGLEMESDTAATLPIASIEKIEVTGLPNDLVGSELYLAGALQPEGTWTTPGENASLLATITDNGDGTCTLTYNVNADFDAGSYGFKFAAAGWSKPEVCAESGDASVTLAAGNTIIKGVYVSSNEVTGQEQAKDNGMQYFCTWSAE